MTELKERSRKQKAELEKRMMGDGSDDEEDEKEKGGEDESNKCKSKLANEDSGCSWGMGELFCWLQDYATVCYMSAVSTHCCHLE